MRRPRLSTPTTTRRLFAVAALTLCGALVATLTGGLGPAVAAPRTSATEFNAGLDCTGTTTDGQRVFASVTSSAQFGDTVFVEVGPHEDPALTGFSLGGDWDGDRLGFDLAVYTGGGGGGHREGAVEEPLLGRLSATTTTVSTSEYDDRGGSGNQHVRISVLTAQLRADATLLMPGVTIDELECSGRSTTSTYDSNQPASTVRTERRLYDSARCTGNAQVGLFGPEDGEYYLSVEVGEANAQRHLFGVVDPSRDHLSVTLPLRDSQTGEVLGQHAVTLDLAAQERPTRTILQTATARIVSETRLHDVRARVSLPDMDVDATCDALEVVTREHVRASQGPQPTGRPPANDTAAGAGAVAVGDTAQASTRGASILAEAAVPCAAAAGRTVWFRVKGTGKPLTLDTAGSGFDTVVTVHDARRDGSLRRLACANDVEADFPYPTESLQATVTVPTEAGRTYWVQAGGVYADYGRLRLAVS